MNLEIGCVRAAGPPSRARRRRWPGAPAASLLIGWLAFAASAPGGPPPQRPASGYKTWLEDEVAYIITPVERDVFLKLGTDRERDLFVESFWKHRDDASGGTLGSARAEHYRRLASVDRSYGRTATVPGRKTDRGRIYILLGEPMSVKKYDTSSDIYPTEVWFYQNKEGLGLPPGFYVVFFQERGAGDYRLYSPSRDGPQSLLTTSSGNQVDFASAYQSLNRIAPDLASVSMSLIPGESSAMMGRPTLSSDLLLKKIEDAPRRQVADAYARKFLEFKDVVDVEYSSNYLESDALFAVLREPDGPYFVHYAIEPAALAVEQGSAGYAATLRVSGSVTDPGGRVVYQFGKTAAISMTADQVRGASRTKFDYHDMFPLIPGTYKVSVLILNPASKEFMSAERTMTIPAEGAILQMTAPILAFHTAKAEGEKGRLKPFRMGPVQLYVQPNRVFAKAETLTVALQLWGLSAAQRSGARIRYVFSRDGLPVRTIERAPADYPAFPDVTEDVALADFTPAHYGLTVTASVDGRDAVAAKEEFDVTPLPAVSRPWFYSKLLPELCDPAYGLMIGGQLAAAGRFAEAQARLEDSHRRMPDSADAALTLARLYRETKSAGRIAEVLDPFLVPAAGPRYDVLALAAWGRLESGRAAEALDLYKRGVARFGASVELLNGIGAAEAAQGRAAEARAAWEQSLKLDPGQPDVRKKLETIKEPKSACRG